MSVTVPFGLKRRAAAGPATAVLLLHEDAANPSVAPALELCARSGLDPAGRIFAVAVGLLVKLDAPLRHAVPGGIRLRGIARDLLVPADADLVPALLDDEASGLTRSRGLVVLPPGRAFAYDPRSPLEPSALLIATRAAEQSWGSPPEPDFLAETIAEFVVEGPGGGGSAGPEGIEDEADRALDPDDPNLGTEEARPDPAGPGKGAVGHAAFSAGKGLLWLGGALGLSGLQGLGAKLIQGAVGMVPRLSESVLGKQAAALRDLLRDFEAGNIDRALRRALPLNDPPGRGSGVVAGESLPENDPHYRLDSLLRGPSGGGATGYWNTEPDLRERLVREYRRAAAEALERGDARRAAFIYGRLLGDFRSAANALQRGGLHRDAAAIFLARLQDSRSAARAYEAAGDFDRAIALYRELNDHEAAGDLLRKIGQEAEAIEAYCRAAQVLADVRGEYALAGALLIDKAGRPDLAEVQFRAGWERRPGATARACALRLAELLARSGRGPDLRDLVADVITRFRRQGDDTSLVNLLHEIARLGDQPGVQAVRDDLRDAVRLALAEKLRGHADQGRRPLTTVTASIFGGWSTWTPPSVRDAEFALNSAIARFAAPTPRAAGAPSAFGLTVPGTGTVAAAVAAWEAGDVFLGFSGGEVFAYRPETSEVVPIVGEGPEVASLAVTADGRSVAVLCAGEGGTATLATYYRVPGGGFQFAFQTSVETSGRSWLTPIVSTTRGDAFGLWDGRALSVIDLANLTWRPGRCEMPIDLGGFLFPAGGAGQLWVLGLVGPAWYFHDFRDPGAAEHVASGLTLPDVVEARPGAARMTATISGGSEIGIVVIGRTGGFAWNLFELDGGGITPREHGTSGRHVGYRTGAILNPRQAIALTETRIDWFDLGSEPVARLRSSTDCALAGISAVFPSRRTGELIAVSDRGAIRHLSAAPGARVRS